MGNKGLFLLKEDIIREVNSLEKIINRGNINPLNLKPEVLGMLGWDYLGKDLIEEIMVNMWKQTFNQALKNIPFYRDNPTYSNDSNDFTLKRAVLIFSVKPPRWR